MRIKTRFYFFADLVALLKPRCEIFLHLAVMLQVVADDCVDIGKVECAVLLDDLLGSRTIIESVNPVSKGTRVPATRTTPLASVSRGTGSAARVRLMIILRI